MLRRVGVLGVDGTQSFIVRAIGEPQAAIVAIGVTDDATGMGYGVYPDGEQAYCTPGHNLRIGIAVTNVGLVDGDCFARIIDSIAGIILYEHAESLRAGETRVFMALLDMPGRDISLTVEVGH